MLIAVDLDGTVHNDCYPDRPISFIPGAKEALEKIRDAGHTLVIHSLRLEFNPALLKSLDWLKEQGIDFLKHPRDLGLDRAFKSRADLFLEDKIPGGFMGWSHALICLGIGPKPGEQNFRCYGSIGQCMGLFVPAQNR